MKELKYPYSFFDSNECFEYVSIEELLEKVNVELERHDSRIAGALTKCQKLLTIELEFIVEAVLIRHLELWAESLNEEVEVDDSNNFVFKGNLYSGILYREITADGTWIYYKSPTENTVEIVYAKDGDVLHYNIRKNVAQYLLKDKWYTMSKYNNTIIFNLTAGNPVCFEIINNVPARVEQPIEFVSDLIRLGLIPTEIDSAYKMFS
jgi:hypothetical protein